MILQIDYKQLQLTVNLVYLLKTNRHHFDFYSFGYVDYNAEGNSYCYGHYLFDTAGDLQYAAGFGSGNKYDCALYHLDTGTHAPRQIRALDDIYLSDFKALMCKRFKE